MQFIWAILIIFWWIAIWGLFDMYTENKTKNEKIKIYLIILGIITSIVCFHPQLIKRMC